MNSRRLIYFAVVFVVAALATIIMLKRRNTAPIVREVALEQLSRHDGRMFFADETKPFTGFLIEHYPSGELKARSHLNGGLLNGLSEGWYTNGVLQIQENFHDGISNGLRTKWHENGQKMSEANIVDGKIVGEFRRWHPNGELAEVIHLKNGDPEGDSWAFYPSGYARASARHENGVLVHRELWKDGEHKVALAQAQ